ncbi:hypothetical protein BM524_18245 [Alteromonas mediterranea]|uniref:Lipoprotein n=1 Tax=Alteromonas mediterranea TaxID=314275 RepID=A0AAC9JFF5_9ALTE|nr:hypothetical protein [Alteromonas mediterranea]APD91580.1 hypothetical protein BM524_18245 [Alteromonas mediterranea]
MKKLLYCFVVTTFLTACESTPPPPHLALEKENISKVTPIASLESKAENKQKIDKVRYLARHLMGVEQQELFINNLQQKITEWDYSNTTIGFLASSAITGNPLSSHGLSTANQVEAALNIISYFADGSKDVIGQMWLPREVDGVEITSEDQATKEAERLSLNAIAFSLDKLGYSKPKYVGTLKEGAIKLYTAELINKYPNPKFPLQPENLTVLQLVMAYDEVKSPKQFDKLALGFTPAYQSTIAGHQIILMGGEKFDSEGNLVMATSESGQKFPEPKQDLWMTSIGREFFRKVSSQIPWIQGKDLIGNRALVYNSEIYTFFATRANSFISSRIDG